jgi:glycerate-2-kinase
VLEQIYRETLTRCAPERLVPKVWRDDFPRTVVAIGKCAGALRDGIDCDDAFVVIPEGYRKPEKPTRVAVGGHPHYTDASFAAGEALLEFVDAHDDITFLISGGGSACVEVPLAGFTREELIRENARLIASGLPIGEINEARKKMSAIKGGKLAQRVRGHCVTLVYSDVSSGALGDVASGPTIPGSDEVHLIADNDTLTGTAAEIARERGFDVIRWSRQIDGDVEGVARELAERARELKAKQIIIAGGEPTTVVRGKGKGGRCSELAVRFALHSVAPAISPAAFSRVRAGRIAGATQKLSGATQRLAALFASSDGVDGNSGAAGILLDPIPTALDRHGIDTELGNSNSMIVATAIGRAIMIPPAGNNLRDLYLLARG